MITYKPHTEKDIPLRVKWLNNPKVNKFIGDHPGQKTTLAKEKAWFLAYKKDIAHKIFFTIYADDNPIGFMGLSYINKINKNASIFIAIGEDSYRGKGIGREAIRWLLDFGFNKLQLRKISLAVFKENTAAVKLYESEGFKIEGVLKDNAYFSGKYHNLLLMAKFNKK